MYAGRIVERSGADALFDAPAHPYTEALLRSVPHVDAVGGSLAVIPGTPPRPGNLPSGCSFHPRCAWAVASCRAQRPALVEVAPSRSAACLRTQEVLHAHA